MPKIQYNFQINYKWIQGFLFEGSPQFTGFVNSYGLLDLQINKTINLFEAKISSPLFPKTPLTQAKTRKIPVMIKLGASNILDNQISQAYGGPKVGRLSYLALLFEFN